MFEHPLPLAIKPVKLARQEGKLSGFMPLKQLSSLAADCVSDEGRVEADLQLRMEQSRPEIHGTANAEVKLVCQRCLEPVAVKVDVSIALGFVQDEAQIAQLPESLEPFMLEEEEVPLAELLEQELILALPIVAYHDTCEPYPYAGKEEAEAAVADEKPNPFAVLEQLKDSLKKSDK